VLAVVHGPTSTALVESLNGGLATIGWPTPYPDREQWAMIVGVSVGTLLLYFLFFEMRNRCVARGAGAREGEGRGDGLGAALRPSAATHRRCCCCRLRRTRSQRIESELTKAKAKVARLEEKLQSARQSEAGKGKEVAAPEPEACRRARGLTRACWPPGPDLDGRGLRYAALRSHERVPAGPRARHVPRGGRQQRR